MSQGEMSRRYKLIEMEVLGDDEKRPGEAAAVSFYMQGF